MAELFCNGGAMRGGNLHHNVSAHTFLGTVRTAPKYRFFSVRDEFPALLLTETGGASIEGELYDVPIGDIRTDFLPEEPEELELTVIELSDGRSVLAVGLRPGLLESRAGELTEITDHGAWRRYRGLPEPDNTTVS
ncbi:MULTISPECIES: gamma-glutamylcyclotransferase [Rhodococcus]|uniref:allophanate hydrolase-related protein n=1 Tax=Rhodococcus sp. IEGM 1305 TaxID=3047092 RepID=UPI0022F2CC8D|nr:MULTISPECIES: gamma-glutamylcyclotransferase [Rhodococcus]MDI9948271.1 gamma-glutamylcyclotransferase [Rhodococcus sp. IEGM 1305]GLK38680.1 gamma-glutamylcyclotransferase [Rhodococcus wratislaviensis]